MNLRSPICLAVGVLLLVALPAGAALYKWTDEAGRVVYGDTPPPGVKAERMITNVPPADPSAVRDIAAKDAQMKKRQQERTDADAKSQKSEAEAKAKLDRCVQIRGHLAGLRSDAAIYRFNEKGEKVYYDQAERDKAAADDEKQLRDLECPSAPAG
jgi:hypothetical protein